MENIKDSVESLIEGCVAEMGYTTYRGKRMKKSNTFGQLPAAMVCAAEVVAIEGGERCRITFECEVLFARLCLGESERSISDVFALIAADVVKLSSALSVQSRVVNASSSKVEIQQEEARPQQRLMVLSTVEVVIDHIVGSTDAQIGV